MIRRLTLALLVVGTALALVLPATAAGSQVRVSVGAPTTDAYGTTHEVGEFNFPPRMLEVVANDARAAFAACTGRGA
jgi:hypothetical protein